MDAKLYPIKFRPILKETVWGGGQIASFFSRTQDPNVLSCGESWEVSGLPGNVTSAENGPLKNIPLDVICRRHTKALLGVRAATQQNTFFPLLVKYLSTQAWLSIQVHPDNLSDGTYGKTEIWVILDSQPNSYIYLGVLPKWWGKSPQTLIDQGEDIIHCLQKFPVRPGDVFFIPAGQIHALGPNIIALEIQQANDTTYRIYDWNRGRPLQKEFAAQCLSMTPYSSSLKVTNIKDGGGGSPVFSGKHFACNKLFCSVQSPLYKDFSKWDHFVIWSHIQGGPLDIVYDQSACVRIYPGDTVVIPACIHQVVLTAKEQNCVLIESYVPLSPFAFDL